jgi:formate hydrogenlyase subunit 3/multisubunit Na+/H+ antiporter MnhD subunit
LNTAGALWIVASVLLPFALGLLAFVAGHRVHRSVAWISAAALPLAALGLTRHVAAHGVVRVALGGWGRPLGIELHADAVSVLMLLLSAIVGSATSVYALAYFHVERSPGGHRREHDGASSRFWPLWLMLWGSLNALFVAADAFNVYVTLELVTLASVGLVCVEGGRAAQSAAFRYLMVALIGSLSYLFGVGLLYGTTGVLDLQLIGVALVPGPAATVAASAMLVGLVVKAALFPFHFWLPGAHSNAPAPVSALLSALVVKASFYLVLRLWLDVFAIELAVSGGRVLSLLGAAAVLWGSAQALRTPRLKLLVAYSTVAQLGYLFLVLPLLHQATDRTLVMTGVLAFALAHGLAKAAAFMAAGSVAKTAGHDRIADLAGVGAVQPLTLFAFGIAGVSLSGLPPSGGFAAKWLLVSAAISARDWFIVWTLVVGGLLAAAYVARVLRAALRVSDPSAPPARARRSPLDWPTAALAIAVLLLGFAVDPMAGLLAERLPALVAAPGWLP